MLALGRRRAFYVMLHGGDRSAPRVIAALAGLVHDRQRTANYERDDDNDSYYESAHCNDAPAGLNTRLK